MQSHRFNIPSVDLFLERRETQKRTKFVSERSPLQRCQLRRTITQQQYKPTSLWTHFRYGDVTRLDVVIRSSLFERVKPFVYMISRSNCLFADERTCITSHPPAHMHHSTHSHLQLLYDPPACTTPPTRT